MNSGIARTKPPNRRRKGGPRKGRVVDEKYLDFIHAQPCVLAGKHICKGALTAHHVREFGGQKHDRRTLPMCAAAHLHDADPLSIERLGKVKFQAHWNLNIELEMARLNLLYGAMEIAAEIAKAIKDVAA